MSVAFHAARESVAYDHRRGFEPGPLTMRDWKHGDTTVAVTIF